MKRLAEVVVFLSLALAVHLGIWLWSPAGGVSSSGDGGKAIVSLAASSASLAKLVRQWGKAPSVTSPPRISAPRAPDLPRIASLSTKPQPLTPPPSAAPRSPGPQLMPAPQRPDASPMPDITPPKAPPPKPRPKAKPPQKADKKSATGPTAPRQSAPAYATARQIAAGQGGRHAQGRGAAADVATRNATGNGTLIARWGARIRRSVERRKRYPLGTRASGTTIVQLQVGRKGQLMNLRILKSSGEAALDEAALKAVRTARLPSAPGSLPRAQTTIFNLPISFSW